MGQPTVRKDDLGHVVRHWRAAPFTSRRLAWSWMPPHPTLYVRRSWYERVGGFDTMRISAIVDARFSLIVDGETASSRTRPGGMHALVLVALLRSAMLDLEVGATLQAPAAPA